MYLISKFADCTTTYKTNFDKINKTGINFNNLNEVYCGLDFNQSSQIADNHEKIYDAVCWKTSAYKRNLRFSKYMETLRQRYKSNGKLLWWRGINKNELKDKIKENNLENDDIVGFLPSQYGPLELVSKSKYFIFQVMRRAGVIIGEAMACKRNFLLLPRKIKISMGG